MQNEVVQCVRLVDVGAATNQVLVENSKQSSLGREDQAIKWWWIEKINQVSDEEIDQQEVLTVSVEKWRLDGKVKQAWRVTEVSWFES